MNATFATGKEIEPGDRDAAPDRVGVGAAVLVNGEPWFVDLGDLFENRTPGHHCGKRLLVDREPETMLKAA